MKRTPRTLWNLLSPIWQGFVRQAEAFEGETPTTAELKRAFATATFNLGTLDGGEAELDLAPLAWFPALEELRVYGGVSLATLPRLPRLTKLSAEASAMPDDLGTRVPRLAEATFVPRARHASAYRGLRCLAEVTVETGCEIDLAALVHLPALRRLRVVDGPGRQVPALAGLGELRELRELELLYSSVASLPWLAALTKLEKLSLFCCAHAVDLTPLRGLARLRSLDLTSTPVHDLSPLAGLASLRSLNLSSTRVSDLSPLAALDSLAACGTPIRDLAPLASHTELTQLDLRGTDVIDVRPLHALRRLAHVNLAETSVSFTELEALAAALPSAKIEGPQRPLAHFPGEFEASSYEVVKSLFDAGRILRSGDEMRICEGLVGRRADCSYEIQEMTFEPEAKLWTLWLDADGTRSKLELWEPRDVRVGPKEFWIGGAREIRGGGGERFAVIARTAFRLA